MPAPTFSIVIPTFNHLESDLKPCLSSIMRVTDLSSCEIIISANGCTDGTEDYARSLAASAPVRLMSCQQPLGYAAATNAGMAIARGEYIVLLNNDTVMLDWGWHWLDILRAPFLADPGVGVTGPSKRMMGQYPFIIFYCAMFRRSLLYKVGFLDEAFSPGSGEDCDFCIRAFRQGMKIVQVPRDGVEDGFPIWHKDGQTVNENPSRKETFARNNAILIERYMRTNFAAGGRMGDFIHSLYVVKNLCEKSHTTANIRLVERGGAWGHGIKKAYEDCKEIVAEQPYAGSLGVDLPPPGGQEVDLSSHRQKTTYGMCWSQLLSGFYGFDPPRRERYKWLETKRTDPRTQGKIVLHRSILRHNPGFPWGDIIGGIKEDMVFVTSVDDEWKQFPFKNGRIQPLLVPTITEMAVAISSGRLFIGNQSSPMALAFALDANRLVELDPWVDRFYAGEEAYSDNVSWFLDPGRKHVSASLPGGLL